MPEWIQQAGIAIAVIFVVVKLAFEFAFRVIIWKAKKRNGGQFPDKMDRRCNETVKVNNPGNSGTTLIVAKLDSLEKVLCLKLGTIQDALKDLKEGG